MSAPKRRPSPFVVGERVRDAFDGPGLLAARCGTVVAVLDEWPTVGHGADQAIEVRFDRNIFSPDAIGYAGGWGAIRPWSAFAQQERPA